MADQENKNDKSLDGERVFIVSLWDTNETTAAEVIAGVCSNIDDCMVAGAKPGWSGFFVSVWEIGGRKVEDSRYGVIHRDGFSVIIGENSVCKVDNGGSVKWVQ